MSTPASAPPSRTEKADENPRSEPSQTPEPSEPQETRPAGEVDASRSPSDGPSEGEYSGSDTSSQRDCETADWSANPDETQPPLPNEPLPSTVTSGPPLPAEPIPERDDDGWEFHWNPNDQSYWFYNRLTGVWQQENPRMPSATAATTAAPTAAAAITATTTATSTSAADAKTSLSNPTSIAGGYNPAVHGDYDENAWYAQNLRTTATATATATTTVNPLADWGQQLLLLQQQNQRRQQQQDSITAAFFNRRTGEWQGAEQGAERHSDEAKARRQLRAYFDVDAAANMHDGRSLKAERAGKKPSRAELKSFKEKRRLKKEEKRRAWLRD